MHEAEIRVTETKCDAFPQWLFQCGFRGGRSAFHLPLPFSPLPSRDGSSPFQETASERATKGTFSVRMALRSAPSQYLGLREPTEQGRVRLCTAYIASCSEFPTKKVSAIEKGEERDPHCALVVVLVE